MTRIIVKMEREIQFGSSEHSIENKQFGQVCVDSFEKCIHTVSCTG